MNKGIRNFLILIGVAGLCAAGTAALNSSPRIADALSQSKRAAEERAIRKKVAEEEAKLPPTGWNATGTEGVFWRWCEEGECPTQNATGDAVWAIEVWCRDRDCSNVYAKINIKDESGRVVGWTNDTSGGRAGDKLVLVLDTYHEGGPLTASLDELNVY